MLEMNRLFSLQERSDRQRRAGKVLKQLDVDLTVGFFLVETGGGRCLIRGV